MAAQAAIEGARWKVAGGSVRGVTHIHDGRPNQDAFAKWPADTGPHPAAIVAVADGHGGARHFRSEIGARIAVEVTVAALRDLAPELDAAADRDRSRLAAVEIPMRIVSAWNGAARAHLEKSPVTNEELLAAEAAEGPGASEAVRQDPLLAYGATLLAALATERCAVFVQLGDGDVLSVAPDGTTTRPIPPDERLAGNLTTSICRPGAESDFRVVAMPADQAPFALLLLSTDGYANSFRSDTDYLQVGGDFLAMIEKDGMAAVEGQLPEILNHASANGSGDDITVGLLQRTSATAGPSSTRPRDAGAASSHARGTAAAGGKEIAGLEQRLESAEQRIGSMRRALIAAALVAGVAIAYSMRDQLGLRLPWGSGSGKPTISAPKDPSGPVKLPGVDKLPDPDQPAIADKPPGMGKDPKEKPLTVGKEAKGDDVVMGDPAHPLIEQLAAVRTEHGIEVSAVLVFGRPDAAACATEASVWDAKDDKLAAATGKTPKLRTGGAATVPVQVLVPYKDEKRTKAMKGKDVKASFTVSCDGKTVAESERKAVGG